MPACLPAVNTSEMPHFAARGSFIIAAPVPHKKTGRLQNMACLPVCMYNSLFIWPSGRCYSVVNVETFSSTFTVPSLARASARAFWIRFSLQGFLRNDRPVKPSAFAWKMATPF